MCSHHAQTPGRLKLKGPYSLVSEKYLATKENETGRQGSVPKELETTMVLLSLLKNPPNDGRTPINVLILVLSLYALMSGLGSCISDHEICLHF